MAFDLDAIRARLEQTESLFWENDCRDLEDMCEADLTFIRNAPGDIAALIAKLEWVGDDFEAAAALTREQRKRLDEIEEADEADAAVTVNTEPAQDSDNNPNAANPYDTLLCGDCDVPYRDHTNEEGSAPCDNFHFCQDTAVDLRADCADLWDANTALRAELAQAREELAGRYRLQTYALPFPPDIASPPSQWTPPETWRMAVIGDAATWVDLESSIGAYAAPGGSAADWTALMMMLRAGTPGRASMRLAWHAELGIFCFRNHREGLATPFRFSRAEAPAVASWLEEELVKLRIGVAVPVLDEPDDAS